MPLPEPARFLIVDDLEENLRALEALLRRDGLVLHTARSGVEALELLLRHDFALALLDVQMPNMNGFELAELMRGTERTRAVPIIFITAAATDEGRRFKGYEAGAVDYLFKPVDPQILRSKAEVFFELDRQRRELARQRDELRDTAMRLGNALDLLQAHVDNSPLGIVEIDPGLAIVSWSRGAERLFGWTAREMVGRRVGDLGWLDADEAGRLAGLLAGDGPDADGRGSAPVRAARRDGTEVECEWYSSVLRDAAGRPLSLAAQILDVTERRRAEETQKLLVGELNHRVKNTLASVQAIATQTLRHTRNPEEFSTTFSGRIQSLARAHALLSTTTWQGAQLAELIQDQLRLGTIDAARLSVAGPEVQLAPQPALRLALILHELCTNANKYGALLSPEGRVALTWSVDGGQLRLRWEETGGRAVKAPTRRGFGTRLIEQSLKADGGTAAASYRADGIAWDIAMPLAAAGTAEPGHRPAPAPAQPAPVPADPRRTALAGRAFLVVEDEPLVALELVAVLEGAEARVVGPVGILEDALKMAQAETFDAAFLDGNLHGEPVDALAAALTRRNIPFAFVSGYGRESLPAAFAQAMVIGKPFTPSELLKAAAEMLPAGDGSGTVLRLRP